MNPFQWSAANCRILYQLITSGKIADLPAVLDYLGVHRQNFGDGL